MLTKVLPCYYNLTGIVMRASTSSRHVFHTRIPFRCSPSLIRWSSTATLQSSLRDNLTSRAPHTVFDYLSPTPSHLLNVTLADFLPESCYPPGFSKDDLRLPFIGNPSTDPFPLPQGHHLVYFSPQVPSSSLLTDGTDPLQCPGEPFVRRMWAGGSLQFENNSINRLATDNQRSCCTEYISDVSVKGLEGDEKVFVTIARKIGNLSQTTYPSTTHYKSPNELELDYLAGATRGEDVGQWALIEKRNLVFMRQKSAAAAKEDVAKPGKILKPSHEPDFSVALTPTQSLLFRFSALTFNAHAIHLDPQYCREVEGHRNLLVHGPLTLILMLSVLRSQLKEGQVVRNFDYRNLAPLYVGEEMKISVRKDANRADKFDVWIEGREGGYAVKGSAIIEQLDRLTRL